MIESDEVSVFSYGLEYAQPSFFCFLCRREQAARLRISSYLFFASPRWVVNLHG